MSQLTPDQLARVEAWAAEGANLNQIQDRLKAEFSIVLTYLEARLLMADVGIRLKDKARPVEPPAEPESEPALPPAAADAEAPVDASADAPACSVQLTVDTISIPGALASGKVTFSDGVGAAWYVDQMGRLGLSGAPQGYQPPPGDVPVFQQQLDRALMQSGF
jgi:hypothetical protein